MMILRSAMPSPFGRKVKLAASILGLSDRMEVVMTDTLDPADPIRQQNPLGKIPALILETGEALYVASAKDRLERSDYADTLAVAKKHGGWYSAWRGAGAWPGFQFKTEAARDSFIRESTGREPEGAAPKPEPATPTPEVRTEAPVEWAGKPQHLVDAYNAANEAARAAEAKYRPVT